MASGRSHDQATRRLALPYGLLWAPWLGLVGVAVAAGALVLSPRRGHMQRGQRGVAGN